MESIVDGFAAYPIDSALTIEYVATSESQRGIGLGGSLIRGLQRRHPGSAVLAQTDDDAAGFYRRLGFVATPSLSDPRWPELRRYHCFLAPSAHSGATQAHR